MQKQMWPAYLMSFLIKKKSWWSPLPLLSLNFPFLSWIISPTNMWICTMASLSLFSNRSQPISWPSTRQTVVPHLFLHISLKPCQTSGGASTQQEGAAARASSVGVVFANWEESYSYGRKRLKMIGLFVFNYDCGFFFLLLLGLFLRPNQMLSLI